MSIIAEALKKVQESSRKSTEIEQRANIIKKAKSKKPLLFLSILLACLLFYFLIEKPKIEETKEERITIVDNPTLPTAEPAPIFVTIADVNRAINLNGIMYTPEKPLAVINDSIWSEGEEIGEFKILKIEKDSVKLVCGEQEFIVKLKK